ncbi:ganglioside GM2 activator-like [Heterodontus francisci]|uniref:ganglioside GM2 activator-like n=1 Tax=Heterodontus francisci TaxID=7792 RepID=UPI00355B92CE
MALRFSVILLAICLLYQTRTSNGFYWKDCSAAHEPVTFKTISFEPDPIKLPGSVSYKGSLYLSRSLSSVTAEVKLYKKALFWWRIPCSSYFQCKFDICELLNLDSSCSFSSGYFYYPKTWYNLPRISIPSFLLKGYYSATIILKSYGNQVGCVNVYFNVDA